jgi:hypothetical protein
MNGPIMGPQRTRDYLQETFPACVGTDNAWLREDIARGSAAILRGILPRELAAAPVAALRANPDFVLRRSVELNNHPPEIVDLGTGAVKTFIINHPTDDHRYLVHGTLEGPEGAVYYRGTARLQAGRARVVLPEYFEALTRPEGRTVMLTNLDGCDQLAVTTQDGLQIKDGTFLVCSADPLSSQAFNWEVKAARRDVAPLEVEPLKRELQVKGFGPYAYGIPQGKPA